jgi:hypothetical protein
MRVRDLQEFLSKFTENKKDGSSQGNAMSDAVIFVEINGFLEEIKKMEVHENNQKIIGLYNNHNAHRLVLKTKTDSRGPWSVVLEYFSNIHVPWFPDQGACCLWLEA